MECGNNKGGILKWLKKEVGKRKKDNMHKNKQKFSKYTGHYVDNQTGKVSNKVGDLIDDNITERVYKSSVKNPNLRI